MKAHYDDVSVMDNPGRFTILIKNKKLVYSYDTEELLGNIDPYNFNYEEVLWNIRYQWGLLVSSLSLEKNITIKPNSELLKHIKRLNANYISLTDNNDIISEFHLFRNTECVGTFTINAYSPHTGFYSCSGMWIEATIH